MKRWYFIIDVGKCWDCNNCFISCKDEHEGNDWPGYTHAQPRHEHRWIDVKRCERGQYPLSTWLTVSLPACIARMRPV